MYQAIRTPQMFPELGQLVCGGYDVFNDWWSTFIPEHKKALEEKDAPTAFRAAHTLKGVCQNLGFDALYVPSSALTEALRGGSLDGADELFPPVEKEYQRVVEALKALE